MFEPKRPVHSTDLPIASRQRYSSIAFIISMELPSPEKENFVLLRCTLDGLLLPARMLSTGQLVACDGDEYFVMDAMEAIYYEVAAASREELLQLEQAHYRLLRAAADCRTISETISNNVRASAGARSARQC